MTSISQEQSQSQIQEKQPEGYSPSHPGLFEVEFDINPGSHASRLVAKREFEPNSFIALLYPP